MPEILVTAGAPDEAAVLLRERVAVGELQSDGACARLVERVGWALVDADELEHQAPRPRPVRPVQRFGTGHQPGASGGSTEEGALRAA